MKIVCVFYSDLVIISRPVSSILGQDGIFRYAHSIYVDRRLSEEREVEYPSWAAEVRRGLTNRTGISLGGEVDGESE